MHQKRRACGSIAASFRLRVKRRGKCVITSYSIHYTKLYEIPYQPNRAVLHTDPGLLPRNRRVWSAWNYSAGGNGSDAPDERAVSVHYLINKLQPLPFEAPLVVSLNP